MAKENHPETEPKEELTGWQRLHQDYLQQKAREEEEKKKKDEENRRRILKTVPDKKEESSEKGNKKKKKAKKTKQREKKPRKQRENTVSSGQIIRALPVFIVAGVGILLSSYFMSPLATVHQVQVSGNQQVDQQQILEHTGIHSNDYTLTTFLSQKAYEKNIVASSPWIRSAKIHYSFPTSFHIQISEYGIIAYQLKDGKYYPILTDGTIINQEASPDDSQVIVQFDDANKIKELAKALDGLSSSERKQIQTISLTPSTASQDLLTLDMRDGNQVLVPLSEFDKKMAYYASVASQITEASIIDMESGIFSYTKASAEAQEAAKKEQAENQQETNSEASSDVASTDSTGTDTTIASSENGT